MPNYERPHQRPTTRVRPGQLQVRVVFQPPPGQKLDDRYGPSTFLTVSSTPPELLLSGSGDGTELDRAVVISDAVAEGVLHVSVRAASCDDETVANAACHVHQQDWGVPVEVTSDGSSTVTLYLAGSEEPI